MSQVPISSILPYPDNARRGDVDMIRESLKEHGQYRPIVVQQSTGYILAGNHTWLAAQAEGWTEIDAHFVICDDEKARKIVLIDNKANDAAGYDDKALSEMLAGLEGDFVGTGFTVGELDKLLDSLSTSDERADSVPGYGIRPTRVTDGDVWIMGEHRLVCGDSTDALVQSALFDADIADLIVTDPPYGVDYQGDIKDNPELAKIRRRRTDNAGSVESDNLGQDGTAELIYDVLSIAPLKDGGAVYICAPQGDMYPIIWNAVAMAGLSIRQTLVWVKNVFAMGRSDYHYRHELIMYGWKEGAGHFWCGDRDQDSVWEYDRPSKSEEHPTMKPVAMFERMVKNSSERGDIVFDPFAGSGTTVLACEQHDRSARVIELDPIYCEVILSRWEAFTGNKAVREGDNEEEA